MIEAGILDGDTVVIQKQDTAKTGDIVVALIDDEEATLKRLRRTGASIALEAANPAYETRIFGPDRVRIQGKLVGLFRRYSKHFRAKWAPVRMKMGRPRKCDRDEEHFSSESGHA